MIETADQKLSSKDLSQIANGIFHTKILFVNSYFVDTPEIAPDSFVLIDTGLPFASSKIINAVENRYGAGAKPSAIILTHGHFDHAGSALAFAEQWDVLIYAHRLEMPYLTGKSDYPPQDSSMGGAIAQMARFFPHGGQDFGKRVHVLPENGEFADLPGWKIFHTPGHTAGHVSLWRESDRTLLAGDALATMNMDLWTSHITEKKEFGTPAKPFTTDWQAARRSVELLAELEPKIVAAGHGKPIDDFDTAEQLKNFARNFEPPRKGRYVHSPAITDERGVVALPPPVTDNVKIVAGAVAVVLIVGALMRKKR